MDFNSAAKLLFIGDSITDCDRHNDPEQLGHGYVRMVRDLLAVENPSACPQILNRGISGNKIPDLQKRWKPDALDLAPDVLSVYIGINDVWHGLAPGRAGCAIDDFQRGYREILRQTRKSLPACAIVLCEPSVLWLVDQPQANARLGPYVQAVGELAGEFNAAVVPLHEAFEIARKLRPDIDWTTDGVHPTSAGHMLIAQTWLETVRR